MKRLLAKTWMAMALGVVVAWLTPTVALAGNGQGPMVPWDEGGGSGSTDRCGGVDGEALNADDIVERDQAWTDFEKAYKNEEEEWLKKDDSTVYDLENMPCHRLFHKLYWSDNFELSSRAGEMLDRKLYGPKEIVPEPVPLPPYQFNHVVENLGKDTGGDKGDKGDGGGHH